MLTEKQFSGIKAWVYRNARDIDLHVWKFYFEKGRMEDVVSALSYYQNEDGGLEMRWSRITGIPLPRPILRFMR